MNKSWVIKALAGTFVTYALIGFFALPYLIQNMVPEKVSEVTKGGKLTLESVRFNPFTFRLSLRDVQFKTPENSDFIAFKSFAINLNPVESAWKMGWVVRDVTIERPTITVSKDAEGKMNFGWLSELGGDENKSKEPSKPLSLLIKSITLKGGVFDYSDEGKRYHQQINAIGFHLENIDLRDASSANGVIRFYATINEGGFVDFKGKIGSMNPFSINGSIAFNSGKLYTPWRYFKEKLPIEVADGTASFGFDYDLSLDDLNTTKLSMLHAELSNLRIIPKGGDKTLLSLSKFKLSGSTVWPLKKIFQADAVNLDGFEVHASRRSDGVIDWIDYLDQMKKAFPADNDNNETKLPWQVSIKDIALKNIGAQWGDAAPKEPYKAILSGINLHATNVTSDESQPLKASVQIGSLDVKRTRDDMSVAGFEDLSVDGIELNREGRHAHISSVALGKVMVSLKRLKNGEIDLQKLAYASPQKNQKSTSAPYSYGVEQIVLSEGKIKITDEVPEHSVTAEVDQLSVAVEGVSSDVRRKIMLQSSGRINQKSIFEIRSDLVREPLQSKGEFELNHFALPLIDPYIESSSHAQLRRGDLNLKGSFAYSPKKTSVDGRLSLNDWVVDDRRDHSVLLGWNKIGVTPFVYAYPDNRLKINQIVVDGLYANARIDQNKVLNFSTLSKTKKADTNETKKGTNPFGIDVVKLAIENSSATFSDLSLPLPFKTYIHDLKGQVLGISTTKDVTTFVALRGGVDQYGSAKIDGSLNTKNPKGFTDMNVKFDNLELKDYTPYSLQFLGYKIANGKLYLDLGYKINGGALDGKNQVIIKRIQLGEEKEGGSPWPLGLVVALLEDSDGVIDIDLPVQGNVNDPDFKYGKVVWQVIGNLLTKAVTSPFRLLGSLMGIDAEGDKLSTIYFEAGEDTLSPPQKEQLDKLSALLIKRPKLTLLVHGGYALKEDDRALRIQKLVQAVIGQETRTAATHSADSMSLEALEAMAKKSLERSEVKALRSSMEDKYPQEAEFVRNYTAELIERLIALQVIAPAELDALAARRTKEIAEHLRKTPELANRVSIGVSEKMSAESKDAVPSRLELSVK